MSREFLEAFGSLKLANARDRGRGLPRLLSRFFERAGFDVKEGARAASPRDTDVFIAYDDNYLLEAKWTSRRSDIATIDGLRDRLRRCAPNVIGLAASVAGLTSGAIDAVRSDRTRLILLLDGDDLEDLFAARISPVSLLRVRKRVLIRDAATVVGRQTNESSSTRSRRVTPASTRDVSCGPPETRTTVGYRRGLLRRPGLRRLHSRCGLDNGPRGWRSAGSPVAFCNGWRPRDGTWRPRKSRMDHPWRQLRDPPARSRLARNWRSRARRGTSSRGRPP